MVVLRQLKCAGFLLILTASAFAQKPVAELPRVYIDTTYSLPVGGTTRAAHSAAQFTAALSVAVPGDVIILDAGVTYSGNFTFPNKSNPSHKWIYIISSNLAAMPAGTRVGPADAANMPKLVTPGATKAINVAFGANYWRMAGIEVTTASNYPTGCGVPGHVRCMSGQLIGGEWLQTYAVPDHIYIDRCYFHIADNQDVTTAIQANWTWAAVVDSYVSNIKHQAQDSQAIGAFNSTGPFKIVNNYLEGAGENIMFGGSGKNFNIGVPSDIEIRGNYIFKRLSWIGPSKLPSNDPASITVKNSVECKSCLRFLLDGNTIENTWQSGQVGYSLVLTVRSYQSGDMTVVSDITATNNVFKNVVGFVNSLASDDLCVAPCTNAGSQTRWNISNNSVTLWNPNALGWGPSVAGAIAFNGGYDHPNNRPGVARDILFQHNTVISPPGTNCTFGVYFNVAGMTTPPVGGLTNNIWILDNVLCKQTLGSWGTGGTHLADYMGMPNVAPYDLPARYSGNVMLKSTDAIAAWPAKNTVVTSWTFDANGQLVTPDYRAKTTTGNQAGYSYTGITAPLSYNSPIALASGTQSTAYPPVTVLATGGTPPYTFSLQSGAWPTGMTLNASTGVISGTPTASGTFSPNILMTDSAAATQLSGVRPSDR